MEKGFIIHKSLLWFSRIFQSPSKVYTTNFKPINHPGFPPFFPCEKPVKMSSGIASAQPCLPRTILGGTSRRPLSLDDDPWTLLFYRWLWCWFGGPQTMFIPKIRLMVQKSGKITSGYGTYPNWQDFHTAQVVVWDFFQQQYHFHQNNL